MTEYRLSDGSSIFIARLTQEICEEYLKELLVIHNTIPFQSWSEGDLLADGDVYREFLGKWEISRCVFNDKGDIVGLCIGFERCAEPPHYPHNAVYMHRLAVSKNARFRGIGVILHCDALFGAFERGLKFLESASEPFVYGQTNDTPENAGLVKFHKDSGYEFISRKTYENRTDWIMRMSREAFEASVHYRFWRNSALGGLGE